MKVLKYKNFNNETIYYLSSSGIRRSELPKEINSVLHLKLGSTDWSVFLDKPIVKEFSDIKTQKIFDTDNLQRENLKNNDLVIFHGGDVYEISNKIKDLNLQKEILESIKSSKYFLGISAGTVLLSKNSFLTKESTEIRYNHIHEDIAGIGIFNFGLNCHVDMLIEDEYFLSNFNKSLPRFKDDFYMIYDGSYIKVTGKKVEIFGNVVTREDL